MSDTFGTREEMIDRYNALKHEYEEAIGRKNAKIGELLSAISETVKWVPVTERLPEPIDSYVLVQGVNPKLYGHREFHVCQLWDDDHGYLNHPSEWRWMTEAGNVIDDVTHWMPLPEAPK